MRLAGLLLCCCCSLLPPPAVRGYSRGAPVTACSGPMLPRHGYSGQTGPAPAQILLDSLELSSHADYLRVSWLETTGTTKQSSSAQNNQVVNETKTTC